MKTKRLLLAVLLFVIGCGGSGGGDGDGIGDFDGVWNGNASLVEDSCSSISVPDQGGFGIFYNHLVNQDGGRIVLDNGATTFAGTASQDSFSVAATRAYTGEFAPDKSCTETVTWRYEKVLRDNAQFVVRRSDVSCENGTITCSTSFTGYAFRSGGPSVIIDPDQPIAIEGGGIGGPTVSDTVL